MSFRKNGYKAIDWIVDYLQSVDNYPVLSEVSPGQIRNTLPKKAPLEGETFDAMLKDVNDRKEDAINLLDLIKGIPSKIFRSRVEYVKV